MFTDYKEYMSKNKSPRNVGEATVYTPDSSTFRTNFGAAAGDFMRVSKLNH